MRHETVKEEKSITKGKGVIAWSLHRQDREIHLVVHASNKLLTEFARQV